MIYMYSIVFFFQLIKLQNKLCSVVKKNRITTVAPDNIR